MGDRLRWPPGGLRAAVLIAATIALVGIGAAVASPPPTATLDDFDGRTWLVANRESGQQLLLVNGISGLLEADTDLAMPATAGLHFVGSGSGHSLFRNDDAIVAVDDATHVAVSRVARPTDGVAFVGDRVLVLGEQARLVPLDLSGEGVPVGGALVPVPGVAPVVDRTGRAWYLGRSRGPGQGAPLTAVGVAGDGPIVQHEVDASTTSLVLIDGRASAVGRSVVDVEDATRTKAGETTGAIVPEIAVATGDRWATADGSTLVTFPSGRDAPTEVGSEISRVALWHGSIVLVTAEGVLHGDAADLRPVDGVGPGAALHLDGGLLWITTPEIAVAVAPDQEMVTLAIASADLSLCVGDCSAAAASKFLEQATNDRPPPPSPSAPVDSNAPAPTTTILRKLEVAAVTPTVPTASATTIPRPAPAETPTTVAGTPPTTLPTPASTAVVPPGPTSGIPSDSPPSSAAPNDGPGPPGSPGPPGKGKPDSTFLTTPVTSTSSTTTTTTTTTSPPPADPEPSVDLEFSLDPGDRTARADLRVLGRPSACGVSTPATTASLSWTGSATGSREVLITWPSPSAKRSNETSATILAAPGTLEVTVSVCGVVATRTTTVGGEPDPAPTTTVPPTTTTLPPTTTTVVPTTSTTLVPTTTTTTPRPTTSTTLPGAPTTTTLPGPTTTTTPRPSTTTTPTTRPTTTVVSPPTTA